MRKAMALGLAAVLIGGCGGDDGGGDEAATTAETTATTAAPPPRPTLKDCLTKAGAQEANAAGDLAFAQEAAAADEVSFGINQEIDGRVAQAVTPASEAEEDAWRVVVVAKPGVEPDAEAIADPATADLVMFVEGDAAAIEAVDECFAGEYDAIE